LANFDNFSELIKLDPEKALETLYDRYYSMLCGQVYNIIKDGAAAEDIVQEVFMEVWKKREGIKINQSIEAYLRRACRNRTLNHIRDNHVKFEGDDALLNQEDKSFTSEQYISADELNIKIQKVIAGLPEKCGIIFSLSRYEDMSYAEISKELDISVKTVENQISKALRILREVIYKNNDFE
jgi:RNA polymerase sigma-70 factor (ECF subfamily)